MARDYRKTRPSRTTTRRYEKPSAKNAPNGLKWAIIGILLGVTIALAIFWEYAHEIAPLKQESPQPRHPHLASKRQNASSDTVAGQSHAPQFDFYTVLPKMQVDSSNIPIDSSTPPTRKPSSPPVAATANTPAVTTRPSTSIVPREATAPSEPSSSPAPTSAKAIRSQEENSAHAGSYVLQVASVKNYSDADRLKAQLSMLGFSVTIQKNTLDGQPWNRVYVGPFSSKQLALEKQQALRQNNVASIMIKQP